MSSAAFSNFTVSLTPALNDVQSRPLTGVPDFTLCEDVASLKKAHSDLHANSTLIVDFEGQKLGEKGGALSIMTLRTTTSPAHTYIIDAVRLSLRQLRPIFDLLESNNICKVFFDGRKDYSALYHDYRVTLQNVFDMQIADVVSRTARGEGPDDQARRLCGFFHPPEVRGQASSYANVQMLNGLRKCVGEHGVDVPNATNQTVSHESWMQRPLTDQYLKYAASDVLLIHALYTHFIAKKFVDLATLPSQSMRYVSMWRDKQPMSGNMFVAHPLLPLGILREPSYPTAQCTSCNRTLPQEAVTNKRDCWVCRAIKVRETSKEEWERHDEDYDEEFDDLADPYEDEEFDFYDNMDDDYYSRDDFDDFY